ncbi:MAG: autotransporter outer membrane beta-barrel domain-containing protein [Rickettsia endosymbiont of Argas persicus]
MTNNSTKLFQKAIKTGLLTASTIALTLSTSGALGAAQIENNAQFSNGAGFNPAIANFGGGDLKYITNDGSTVNADAAVAISSIDVNGKAPGLFTVNENISMGSVSDSAGGGAAFPVTVADTFTLTLTGAVGASGFAADTYDKLGPITLSGATLIINAADTNPINLTSTVLGNGAGEGIMTVTTPTNFANGIGSAANSILTINLNANSTVTGKLIGQDLNIGGTSQVSVTNNIDVNTLVFQGDGQLTVGNGIAIANVTNTAPNTGTLIINGGNILNAGSADAGAGNPGPLKQVTFNNSNANGGSTAGNLFATNLTIGQDAGGNASIVKTGTINGAVNFANAGTLTANGLITGNVIFNAAGTLNVGAGVNGAITTAGNNGTVNVTGGNILNAGTNGNALTAITFNNGDNGGPGFNAGNLFATTVTIGEDAGNVASIINAGAINGAVNFANAGTLTVSGGITGAVTTAGDAVTGGTLIVTGGNIGNAGAAGNVLTAITFNNSNAGGGSTAGNLFATNITIGQDAGGNASLVQTGTVNGAMNFANAGTLKANGLITGDVTFNAAGILNVGAGVNGAITTAGNNGTVIVTGGNIGDAGAAGNALTAITFNNGNAGGGSTAGNLFATTVTIGKLGTTASIVQTGTINGAVNFAQAGTLTATGLITGNVTFAAAGTLNAQGGITGNLTVSNGGIVTAGANVTGNVAVQDGAGAVKILNAIGPNAVTIGNGGPLTITTAANGINFVANAAAGTIVNVANGGNVGNMDNTTGGDGIGTVNFVGNGTANSLGATNALAEAIFNREVTIAGVTKAQTITINNDNAEVKARGAVTGAVNFAADGIFSAKAGITGAVTAANGNGTLQTSGDVTGAIGATGANLKILNVGVDDGDDVTLEDNVFAQTINFGDANFNPANAVGEIIVAGAGLSADTLKFGTNANGGTLTFNSADDEASFYATAINNADKGTLNINTTALFALISVADIATINIQDNKELIFDTDGGDINFPGAGTINFKGAGANSTLGFAALRDDGSVVFTADFAAANNNKGSIFLIGQGDNTLTVKSDDPTHNWKIGDAGGNKFASVSALGNVVIDSTIDISGTNVFDVLNGAVLIDNGGTSANIPTINIGAADVGLGVPNPGPAEYTIEAGGVNTHILTGANAINFLDPDANLILQNSSGVNNGTITLDRTLDPGAPNTGIVTLNSLGTNGKTLIITGAAGVGLGGTGVNAANTLKQLVFTGAGGFNVQVALNIANIEVGTTAPITLGVTNSNITIINDGVNLTQAGNVSGFIDFNSKNSTVTLNNNVNVAGAVKNSGATSGTIIAEGASNIASVNNIAMLKVGAGAVTIGAAGGNTTTITEIQGNGTELLTLPANFKLTGGFNLTGGKALKLSIADGSSFSDAVGTNANPVGDITLTGTNTFAGGMNSSDNVTLAQNSVTNFAGNIKATSFKATGATLNFTDTSAFTGNITGSGTTISLGSSTVTYTGQSSFTDVLTLNTTYDGATKTGGNILIKSGSNIDLSQVSSLNLNVTVSNVNLSNISDNAQFKLITSEAAGGLTPVSNDKIKVTVNGNENRFIGITVDTSNLTLFATNIASKVIDEDFENKLANIPDAAAVKQSFKLMEAAPEGSDANLALDNFGLMTPTQAVDAINHLRQNSVKPSEVIAACSQAVSGNIFNNLASINTRVDSIQAANNFAVVAAGDEDMDAKFGGWVNPFIGNATQKKKNNISGYKSDITGGTIGFDGMINDDAVLGLAYTRADTDVKLKDSKQGDKNKIKSNIYSIYGLYNLPNNNFFVEGVASYGDSKVRTKSQRNIATAKDTIGYQTAKGKYKSENYTGQLMVGYNYTLPETVSAMPLIVTPLAGLRYSDIKDKGYKETGTTYQNLIVKGKNYNTFDGLVGAKLSSSINTGEVTLIPELHALVDYAFKNKAPAIDARLQGMPAPFPTNSFKPSKTSFDLGAGVTVKHKMMEYGLNYDANIASKYFAQQGSLKVRVNF